MRISNCNTTMKLVKSYIKLFPNRSVKFGLLIYLWCAICVTVAILLFLWIKLETRLDKKHGPVSNKYESVQFTKSPYSTSTRRQVTKSLSELMQEIPEINEDIILFNRIPSSGSELIVLLLHWLEDFNGFKHVRLADGEKHRLNRLEQEEIVERITNEVKEGAIPFTFDRHIHFVNFSSFGRQSPTYLNIIRNPIDKAVARFYKYRATPAPTVSYSTTEPLVRTRQQYALLKQFERCVRDDDPKCTYQDGELYDLSISYFCGHDKWCMLLNDQWALQQAKEKVERYYPVVGVLEEINKTFTVLEHKLPYFFKGALDIFNAQFYAKKRSRVIHRPVNYIEEDVKLKLEQQLALEFEFYDWLNSRLMNQFLVAFDELVL